MQQRIDLRMNNARPTIGITKKVSVTAPKDVWAMIADLVKSGVVKNQSEAWRMIATEWGRENKRL